MKYLQTSFTMPQAKPDPAMCCDACVFGRGEHAEWCPQKQNTPDYRILLPPSLRR